MVAESPWTGRWLGHVDRSLRWSRTTRLLLDQHDWGQQLLVRVALFLALHDACLLVQGRGKGRKRQPAYEPAVADCPFGVDGLRIHHDRLAQWRDEVVHFADQGDGAQLGWRVAVEEPVTYSSTVGDRDKRGTDELTRPEIEEVLVRLDDWLHPHWDVLVSLRHGSQPGEDDALALKVARWAMGINTPPGWRVGSPSYHDEAQRWEMHARGPTLPVTEATEWTAVAPTKVGVLAEMARCLRELGEGRWPR